MAEAVRVDAAAAASDAAETVKSAEEISTKTTDRAKKLTEQANPKDESMYVVDLPPVTVPVVKLLFAAPLGQPLHFVEE
jgi:hypothetical protein